MNQRSAASNEMAVLSCLAVLGCSTGPRYSEVRFAQASVKAAEAPTVKDGTPEAARGACELRLYIEQRPSGGQFGLDTGKLGVAAVERVENTLIDGVCLKRAGEEFMMPAGILVASTDDAPTIKRFCLDEPTKSSVGKAGAATSVNVCTWDGTFHSARPFTFTFVSAKGTAVGDLVEFVRIYRNGDLTAAWNRAGDQPSSEQVILGGKSLRSGFFAATHPPHRAAMDLRVIPRGADVKSVDLEVRNDKKRMLERFAAIGKVAADEVLPADSPARDSLECLKKQVAHAQAQIKAVVHGEIFVPNLDAGCSMQLTPNDATPLGDAYADAKNQTEIALAKIQNDAEAKFDALEDELEKKLSDAQEQALEKGLQALHDAAKGEAQALVAQHLKDPDIKPLIALLEQDLKKRAAGDPAVKDLASLSRGVRALLADVDHQVRAALRTVDETRLVARDLYEKATEIVRSPGKQAQIFNAVALGLQRQEDTFEPRRDNPPLLAGEQHLHMEYADSIQGFVFAPWNGVPFHGRQADFNGAVAIPLIDVVGMRVQWDKSRLADARLALGIGYTQTKLTTDAGVEQDESGWLPNASVGFANLKFGVGVVLGGDADRFKDRLRYILGVDFYKLISGGNVELF